MNEVSTLNCGLLSKIVINIRLTEWLAPLHLQRPHEKQAVKFDLQAALLFHLLLVCVFVCVWS